MFGLFGTSGIRGIYGKDITEDLAAGVASIFASGKDQRLGSVPHLVVGRDIRESGPSLFEAVCNGASSAGAEIIDLGIVPTPTVALATKIYNCRGIMLTASHNPPEYNGLKLIEDGKEIGKELEKEITNKYSSRSSKPQEKTPAVNAKGRGIVYLDHEIINTHKRMVIASVNQKIIARKKPMVIIDCNGAGSVITPHLLSDLGCKVISVNASRHCFNRASEPNKDNLAYLSEFVRNAEADFAIAQDGDGDRCVVLDENGEVLPFDVQLAIMIEHELEVSGVSKDRRNRGNNNRNLIVSTVEASLTIRGVVEQNGGMLEITPVGSTYVGDMLEERSGLFGGEPCGEYIYAEGVHVPDAVMATAKFAEIFCENGSFSKLKTRYHQNFMAREKFPAKDKLATMEAICKAIRSFGIAGKLRTDDGIRIDEKDGWFLIRASGTEPIIRLTMEYKTKEKLEERKEEMKALIASKS